ncbi:MAG: Fis family transcriptional regulator [Candidatus Cloacimonadota bacterium]|nr:MAG: Fis family transcriptional regulator [Candidatus Cloacimonadota bacterium]PIE77728.1 MAG: Fis family transcriptional regulator [Candidatus Delongbacteria bacterium]
MIKIGKKFGKNCRNPILESISDGVFTVDSEWKITYFNRAAENILSINREDAIGQLCSEVFKSSMCEMGCPLKETLDSGDPVINRGCYIISNTGRKIPISVSTAVLRDKSGNIIGGAETFRDLSELEKIKKERISRYSIGNFISHSKIMSDVLDLAKAVANTPTTVLIEGETGTGKEVLARAIHSFSNRSNKPFIGVNCGALPENLLESELFGFKKGAFTGANRDKKGRFSLAKGGTIFLDEIGELSLNLQVKLLRVLQERVFEPLGSEKSEKCEARIIAATHRNLKELISLGKFRQDLYYRINVVNLSIPPLNLRKDDIPVLIEHFIDKFNNLFGKNILGVEKDVYGLLLSYEWPGNVRELENVIERTFVVCNRDKIGVSDLPLEFGVSSKTENSEGIRLLNRVNEREIILSSIAKNGGNISKVAGELKIHKSTLYRKIKRLGIILGN